MFRRQFSYANVVATVALVFAMSGGALAASRYVIHSTKQISPKVLKKLRGKVGPKGAKGTTGATGATGATGTTGVAGTPGATGATGVAGTPGATGATGEEGPTGKEGKEGAAGTLASAFLDKDEATLLDVHNFSTTYTSPEAGVYCLKPTGGVNPTNDPIAMVTVEWDDSGGSDLAAYVGGEADECEAGEYEVRTYDPDSSQTLSNDVSFYITIPG